MLERDILRSNHWEKALAEYQSIIKGNLPQRGDIARFTIHRGMFYNGQAIMFHGEAHAATVAVGSAAIFVMREARSLLPREIISNRERYYQGLILGSVSHDLEATEAEKDYRGHGLRAALTLANRFRDVDKGALRLAKRICIWHVPFDEKISSLIPGDELEIIKIAKDADGITRKRFPETDPAHLNESFLRFSESRILIPVIAELLKTTTGVDTEDPAVGFGQVLDRAVEMGLIRQ